jgi:hypothetical protein
MSVARIARGAPSLDAREAWVKKDGPGLRSAVGRACVTKNITDDLSSK